ncbi:hypothetical protein REPUB_Repub11eG0091500 [Reevesia pubescens]
MIKSLREPSEGYWCCRRVFNVVRFEDEKLGGRPIDRFQSNLFNYFLDECGLMELGLKGMAFTWSNNKSDEDNIKKKLDKVVHSVEWLETFDSAYGIVEAYI